MADREELAERLRQVSSDNDRLLAGLSDVAATGVAPAILDHRSRTR
jgi:hypothetical protein